MPSDIIIKDNHVEIVGPLKAVGNEGGTPRIQIDPAEGNLALGGGNRDGDLTLTNNAGEKTIHLSGGGGAQVASARVVIEGQHGAVTLKNESGTVVARLGGEPGKADLIALRDQDGEVYLDIGADGVVSQKRVGVKGSGSMTMITGNEISIIGGGAVFNLRDAIEKLQDEVAGLKRQVAALRRP